MILAYFSCGILTVAPCLKFDVKDSNLKFVLGCNSLKVSSVISLINLTTSE